ncbi:MAG: hypothetical protein Q7O04_00985 [Candidatus Omnitrophota bacterium]|nr:hypothetical protein [Candidatus Omnitrophota bacterium]
MIEIIIKHAIFIINGSKPAAYPWIVKKFVMGFLIQVAPNKVKAMLAQKKKDLPELQLLAISKNKNKAIKNIQNAGLLK